MTALRDVSRLDSGPDAGLNLSACPFGWQGERDIHAAIEFLQTRPDVDPQRIGGIGLSVGGEMMIEATAESTALTAIVSEGGSGRSVRDELANPSGKWQELIGTGVATAATSLFTNNLPLQEEPRREDGLAPRCSSYGCALSSVRRSSESLVRGLSRDQVSTPTVPYVGLPARS
jgi:BAAT / Acyl-CoA thioester hydrolase C terminal